MGDRYWEGQGDVGRDMRDRLQLRIDTLVAQKDALKASLDGCCEKVRTLAEKNLALSAENSLLKQKLSHLERACQFDPEEIYKAEEIVSTRLRRDVD